MHSICYAACEYNHSNNITIYLQHETINPKRKGDSSIMKWATMYSSTSSDLKAINRVRISHGLCSISKICEANGK